MSQGFHWEKELNHTGIGSWRLKVPWGAQNDSGVWSTEIGLVESHGHCLITLLRHYPPAVHLGVSLWRKILIHIEADLVEYARNQAEMDGEDNPEHGPPAHMLPLLDAGGLTRQTIQRMHPCGNIPEQLGMTGALHHLPLVCPKVTLEVDATGEPSPDELIRFAHRLMKCNHVDVLRTMLMSPVFDTRSQSTQAALRCILRMAVQITKPHAVALLLQKGLAIEKWPAFLHEAAKRGVYRCL